MGMELATGEKIAFIDSDDIICSNYFLVIEKIFSQIEADVIFFDYKIVPDLPQVEQNSKISFSEEKLNINFNKEKAMTNIVRNSYAWDKVFDKRAVNNIEFPKGKNYEDIATIYKMVDQAQSLVYYNDVLYLYRQREGSITHENNLSILKRMRSLQDAVSARENQLNFFEQNGYERAGDLVKHDLMVNAVTYIRWSDQYDLPKDHMFQELTSFLKTYKVSIKKDGSKYFGAITLYKYFPHIFKLVAYAHKLRAKETYHGKV